MDKELFKDHSDNIYAFKNWGIGKLVAGPEVTKYPVEQRNYYGYPRTGPSTNV
jgi:hypothetical protein